MNIFKFRSLNTLYFLLLTIIIIALYGTSLKFGYFVDDYQLIHTDTIKEIFYNPMNIVHFRPIWTASFWLTNFFGHSPVFDHFFNIFLGILTVFTIFNFFKFFTKKPFLSFALTAFWVCLPWTSYYFVWISARTDFFLIIFTLLSIQRFYEGKDFQSVLFLFLALLSKVTIILLPLFFIHKSYKKKKIKTSLSYLFVFIIYLIFSFYFLTTFGQAEAHLKNLPVYVKLANHFAHLVEFFVQIIIPFPFFSGFWHVLIYLSGLVLFIISISFDIKKINLDLLACFLLTSITSAVTPELRIAGLHSIFLMICILSIITSIKNKHLLVLGLGLICLSYIYALFQTKQIFNSGWIDSSKPCPAKQSLYPNNYYQQKRQFLIKIRKLTGL
ncbi:hypothetical protein ACFLZV_02270 [Candidatus Margulisiibacteriota bacterium]